MKETRNIDFGKSRETSNNILKGLKHIKPVNEIFQEAFDYRTYQLRDTSKRYESRKM